MNIFQALEAIKKAAEATVDSRARNTFHDIYGVISRADTTTATKWAAKTETVIKYVLAGNYSGTYDDAKRILNKRKYQETK